MENKRKILTRIAVLVLALVMAIGTLAVPANATSPTDIVTHDFSVVSYSVNETNIYEGTTFNVKAELQYVGDAENPPAISIKRTTDGFKNGTVTPTSVHHNTDGIYTFDVTGLVWKGTDNVLKLTIDCGDKVYKTVSIAITECTKKSDSSITVLSYTAPASITKSSSAFMITARVKYSGDDNPATLSVSRLVDTFKGGDTITVEPVPNKANQFDIKIYGLTYKGTGNTLKLSVDNKPVSITIVECEEYQESTYEPGTPETKPMPTAIFSRNEITNSIKAGQSFNMTISVKNVGTQTMTKPIISFTTSDSLMVTGTQTAYEMNTIAPGKTESITVPFKALDKISSPNQSVTANVDFTYYTGGSNTNGKASGTLNVPCKTSEKQESTDGAGIPVPNIIVSNFNYGGSSVPSGSQFALDIKLRNTSSEAAVENVVATVSGGSELIINGGTNTKYFSKIGAGQTANITIPFKVAQILTTTAEPVSVAVNYEYVTEGTRKQASSNLTLSVPVYQTDKFEIEQPVFAYEPAVYEETSFTMEYVNKGKSAVSNVEATVSGDVESYQATQRLGNIEAGKSGTIAFAVTPTLEGENHVYVTINYEDANGDIKERVFETVVNAYQMSYDPVEPVEPMPEEPTGPNWKIIIPIIVLALIIGLIVFRKLRKKSKAKKQTKLWEEWEDEDDAPKDDTPETENKSEESVSQDENKEVK